MHCHMPAGKSCGTANVQRAPCFTYGCDKMGVLLDYASTKASTVYVELLSADLLLVGTIGVLRCNQAAILKSNPSNCPDCTLTKPCRRRKQVRGFNQATWRNSKEPAAQQATLDEGFRLIADGTIKLDAGACARLRSPAVKTI